MSPVYPTSDTNSNSIPQFLGDVLSRPLLVCFDGFSSYVGCLQRAFRLPETMGKPGRPSLLPWAGLCLGQIVKLKEKGRVIGVLQNVVQGSQEAVEALLFGANVLNTAYIERVNATFRARLCALVRRGRCLSRRVG